MHLASLEVVNVYIQIEMVKTEIVGRGKYGFYPPKPTHTISHSNTNRMDGISLQSSVHITGVAEKRKPL